ncbi:hypothetical protein SUSAZ_01060 [Sulfolobus acidocaldarius SUSAZ]|nr:hypothetical protein SUSAZ_01060 [Sulfolobus acidocaldarius SUSAZ]
MNSVKLFSEKNEIKNLFERTLKITEELDLVPLISLYLEDEILKKLVRSLDQKLAPLFEKFRTSRVEFVKNAKNVLGWNNDEYVEYIYYAVPISDEVEVMFVRNNWLPPKALILRGKVRYTFMPYSSYSELESLIARRDEEDIIVEFNKGLPVNVDKKRNIYTDFRNVTETLESKKPVIVNLSPTSSSYILAGIIANNVYPLKNRVLITRNKEELTYKILEGKANKNDVLSGDVIDSISKAELYYDYKTGFVNNKNKKIIVDGLLSKMPGV